MSTTATDLITAINAVKAAGPETFSDEERTALLEACAGLRTALENPMQRTMRITCSIYDTAALITAIDMGLFDAAVESATEGKATFTVDNIADRTKADPLLVLRIMRALVAMHIFTETDIKTYAVTPIAQTYVSASPFSSIAVHLASHTPTASLLPSYFLENGYVSPTDILNSPFQYAMRTEKQYFEWVASQPRLQAALNTVMAVNPGNVGQDWFEYYPVIEKLTVKSPKDVVLVDVGGNTGRDLAGFGTAFPPNVLRGRAVLQDQVGIIEKAEGHDEALDIEMQGHDFFTEQPVKDAKAYCLRLVIHDWPDKEAIEILSRIRDAMGDDSILLLNETLVPEKDVPLYDAWVDLTMLVLMAAMNRTEQQWGVLLEKAGFRLLKVWRPGVVLPGSTTLFEAVKR